MSKKYVSKAAHLERFAEAHFKAHAPKSDLKRLKKMSDKKIAADAKADPDVAPVLNEWPDAAYVVMPKKKVPVSLRVDADVLKFCPKCSAR